MARKLRPCGTQSAYRRHLNRGEAPCAECRAANTARTNPGSQSALRVGEQEWGAALEANPPRIVWRKGKGGIMRAVEIQDPHAEGSPAAQARRLRALAEIAEQEEAARQAEITRLQVLELMQAEADEVAERFRKHRADNTPLMNAARRSI